MSMTISSGICKALYLCLRRLVCTVESSTAKLIDFPRSPNGAKEQGSRHLIVEQEIYHPVVYVQNVLTKMKKNEKIVKYNKRTDAVTCSFKRSIATIDHVCLRLGGNGLDARFPCNELASRQFRFLEALIYSRCLDASKTQNKLGFVGTVCNW